MQWQSFRVAFVIKSSIIIFLIELLWFDFAVIVMNFLPSPPPLSFSLIPISHSYLSIHLAFSPYALFLVLALCITYADKITHVLRSESNFHSGIKEVLFVI